MSHAIRSMLTALGMVMSGALLSSCAAGGGECTYDTFTGEWVVTAVDDPVDRCCEEERQVEVVFVEDGGSVDAPVWSYIVCIESARVTAEQVAVGARYSGALEVIDSGTCTPTIPDGYPSALEPSEAVCVQ